MIRSNRFVETGAKGRILNLNIWAQIHLPKPFRPNIWQQGGHLGGGGAAHMWSQVLRPNFWFKSSQKYRHTISIANINYFCEHFWVGFAAANSRNERCTVLLSGNGSEATEVEFHDV